MITGTYREKIFNQEGGEYLKKLFCWPTAVVEHQGKLGVVSPFYRDCFFFQYGSRNDDMLGIKGKDKDGKWFASASNRNKFLDPRELGDWMLHLKVCLMLARAVRRMHMAGVSHSDLGYKNWGDLITDNGLTEGERIGYIRRINLYSHNKVSDLEKPELKEQEKAMLKRLFNNFMKDYRWKE